ncbi:hypothetical protein BGZ95_004564 [Linnemannia exigua]|uniref:Uncharacterized protein n=1 Tax=Linnemannia exigua TaxID=604196 RepID=A0AAD4H0Q7_9FUNG|nr:hypothetical protein BGZ95_004564 [Linnemannia exigua]
MKITLALSALIAMAATAVSAAPAIIEAPANSTLIRREDDCTSITLYRIRQWSEYVPGKSYWESSPESDLHSFELVVGTTFHEKMPKKTSTGNKKNNYRMTRTSDTKLWKVDFTDDWAPVTLTAKGKKYVFKQQSKGDRLDNKTIVQYWHCIRW